MFRFEAVAGIGIAVYEYLHGATRELGKYEFVLRLITGHFILAHALAPNFIFEAIDQFFGVAALHYFTAGYNSHVLAQFAYIIHNMGGEYYYNIFSYLAEQIVEPQALGRV